MVGGSEIARSKTLDLMCDLSNGWSQERKLVQNVQHVQQKGAKRTVSTQDIENSGLYCDFIPPTAIL